MPVVPSWSRRAFVQAVGAAALDMTVGGCRFKRDSALDAFVMSLLERDHIPGCVGCVVVGTKRVWSKGYGWADLDRRRPMTTDTLLSIASLSKPVTATAVMQLWEEGRFRLDDDVNAYLDFPVRNPSFPDAPITVRQLLAHRSSIKDGPPYADGFACGDPTVDLHTWVQGYVVPEGDYYHPDNYHAWSPGTASPPGRAYSNVGYGVLGCLVEAVSGSPLPQYSRDRIFQPLGMDDAAWFLEDLDIARHAVPYSLITDSFELPAEWTFQDYLPGEGALEKTEPGSLFPHCLYGYPNYPDGLLRTTVIQLSRFLRAYINGGSFERARILQHETVDMMLSTNHFGRGLGWSMRRLKNGDVMWGHGGGDPGVMTYMGFRPADGLGTILFFNFSGPARADRELLERLVSEFG